MTFCLPCSPHGSQISSLNMSRQSTQEYNSDVMVNDEYDGDYETPTVERMDALDAIQPEVKMPSPARIRWIGAFQKVCQQLNEVSWDYI